MGYATELFERRVFTEIMVVGDRPFDEVDIRVAIELHGRRCRLHDLEILMRLNGIGNAANALAAGWFLGVGNRMQICANLCVFFCGEPHANRH
jgi:hypothetical protein